MIQMFKNIYNYRELLKTNVQKEIRGKYKGAWLGVFWSLLNPLLLLTVYSIIFPLILRIEIENYTMYLCVALLPWTYFTSSISSGIVSMIANGNIIKKVYFPREIIPISVVISATVNFLISCIVILLFLIFSGLGITWTILLFPLILLLQMLITLAITFRTFSFNSTYGIILWNTNSLYNGINTRTFKMDSKIKSNDSCYRSI